MEATYSLQSIYQSVGYKLFLARHKRRETLKSVAAGIGVSHVVISQIENGRYESLSIKLLFQIARYYKLELYELLAEKEFI